MSTAAAATRVSDLAAIVGDKYVAEPATASPLAIDGVTPAVVVTPGSVNEVAAVLAYAYERDLAVNPAGGLIHQEIGLPPAKIDILLQLQRLHAIEHYDPGDLTIGIGAGATIGDIESLVRDQGQLFPLDIPNSGRATLGGSMAVSAHGPLKHFYGGLREYCLGVRFVTADGKIAKAGARVVKNVAGFDVMKLLIGSYGTLAVITSASFKLFPAPHATRTFVCEFDTLPKAIAFRDTVVASPLSPICLEVFSPRAFRQDSWTIVVRAGGTDRILQRYGAELGSAVTKTLETYEEQKFWEDAKRLGEDVPVTVSVSVPPSFAEQVIAAAEHASHDHHSKLTAWGRVGIGSLIFALDSGMAEAYAAVIVAIRRALPPDGAAVVTRCPVMLKSEIDVWGKSPTHMESMQAIKRALNPKDTLNRGRFLL
jgi:glycolate oxidase FAD binding subunit